MTITDKTVLVTGANRGIGQALVAEALRRGARRVSGGTRQPPAHPDPRVTPLTLDDLSDRAMLEEHLALAALPLTPAYSASKAAAFSLTRSLRALLAGRGVRVHAVLTGPTDTDMVQDLEFPKTSPEKERTEVVPVAARRTGSGTHSKGRVRRDDRSQGCQP